MEVYSDTQNINAAQDAVIQAARDIIQSGAEAVITHNVGSECIQNIERCLICISIFDKEVQTVAQALSEWKAGRLREVTEATVEAH